MDDLDSQSLGEYDLAPTSRRLATPMLLDRSPAGLAAEIKRVAGMIEPLAAYLPEAILRLLVEGAAQRQVPARFVEPAVLFLNLSGLPQAVDEASPGELPSLVAALSGLFPARMPGRRW
jgi:hypothetical protein